MNLQYFPMDRQLCHIEIESCKFQEYKYFLYTFNWPTRLMRKFYQTHCDPMWLFLVKKNSYIIVIVHYVFDNAKYIYYTALMSQCVG